MRNGVLVLTLLLFSGGFPLTNAIRTAIAEIFGSESVMMRLTRVRIMAVGIALFLCASPVFATLRLDDGGVHNIDYEVDRVRVDFGLPNLVLHIQ